MPILSDITLGQYYPVDSFVHRLDPRTKLLVILIGMTSLLLGHQLYGLFLLAVLIVIAIYVSHIPSRLIFRNLRPFLWLFLITVFIHILFSDGATILKIPLIHLEITREGLINGTSYSIRLALLIVFAALLTLTTSPIELTDAIELMLHPFKRLGMPTHELTMMMTLSLRFIPTLMMEADKLRKAQISRGVSFEGSIMRRLKNIIPLILPLFMSVFRRADELALAMDARCYTGGNGRTRYKELAFNKSDYFVLIGSIIMFGSYIFVERSI